jgi:CRISPR-associated protein Csd1
MSWIQKLNETYDQCKGREPPGTGTLLPVSHSIQQAHVEITLDSEGNFKLAQVIGKVETVIPATEQSAGRTGSNPPPHPLCDKVQYCAADYAEKGGEKPSFFKDSMNKKNEISVGYESLLSSWCASDFRHPKAEAVLSYVRKGKLVADLVAEKILHIGSDGKLLTNWIGDTSTPEVFKFLTPDPKTKQRDQGNVFVRWHVREPDNPCTAVWEDASLQDAWAQFDASTKETLGVCMVTGETRAILEMALNLSAPTTVRATPSEVVLPTTRVSRRAAWATKSRKRPTTPCAG